MYKVGICGHFALGMDFANGQVDKTRSVHQALVKAYGENQVAVLDTRNWQKNPVSFFARCFKLIIQCENIIMMPSKNGFRIFPQVFELMNICLRRKLHYVVVGGWLAQKLKEKPSLLKPISRLDRVYSELEPMKAELERMGLENVLYMPNFRQTDALAETELVYNTEEPLKVCTFSRIMAEKGVETAVDAVRKANRILGRTAYVLDIYGNAEPSYEQRFKTLCESFEPFINYRGFVGAGCKTSTLKDYFALLFPTVYDGEGFPGTVIDAFAAGVPVIATDWLYNACIIRNGVDGVIYEPDKPQLLCDILVSFASDPQSLNSMKLSCLERASHFDSDEAVKTLLNELS